jgi:hypothetical protein
VNDWKKRPGQKGQGAVIMRHLNFGLPQPIIRIAHHAPSPILRASNIPTAENFPLLPVQYAADEAAPIFARFYIGTSRQSWRTGLKRWNQMKPA